MSGVHRVSISLNEQEYQRLVIIAESLGIKVTTAAHRAVVRGMSGLSNEAQDLQRDIHNLKMVSQWHQADLVQETKPRTNVQKRQDAKKKKSR